jgi:Ca2+-transporting ATPase
MRVLGVAARELTLDRFDPVGDLELHVRDLTFVGLVGLLDPPRPEAAVAIARCGEAGIDVKMITGDHPRTASAIATRLGLHGEVVTGAEFDTWTEEEAKRRIDDVVVFARVAPEHKVRIVQRLKANDHVVAMTGDGVNDAPALKTADIGVAMGMGGTEVTKEAATLVLTDDNFATIVKAVEEGRAIYDNILKFVRFQLSTNMGAIQAVLGASLFGWGTPFTAIQILWINIVMDGPPAMTLGLEPVRPGVMNEPPRRRDAHILPPRRLWLLMFHGFVMALGTLAVYRFHLEQGETYATTMAFTTFVLFQVFNLFNARREHKSVFNREIFRNFRLWGAVGMVLVLQAVVVHLEPAQQILHTSDLTWQDWALAAGTASSVMIADETRKLWVRLFASPRSAPPSSRRA